MKLTCSRYSVITLVVMLGVTLALVVGSLIVDVQPVQAVYCGDNPYNNDTCRRTCWMVDYLCSGAPRYNCYLDTFKWWKPPATKQYLETNLEVTCDNTLGYCIYCTF